MQNHEAGEENFYSSHKQKGNYGLLHASVCPPLNSDLISKRKDSGMGGPENWRHSVAVRFQPSQKHVAKEP